MSDQDTWVNPWTEPLHQMERENKARYYPSNDHTLHFRDEDGREVEIRTNEDGTLDEIVMPGLHVEQLDDGHWWMSVAGVRVTLRTKRNAKIIPFFEPERAESFTVSEDEALLRRHNMALFEHMGWAWPEEL